MNKIYLFCSELYSEVSSLIMPHILAPLDSTKNISIITITNYNKLLLSKSFNNMFQGYLYVPKIKNYNVGALFYFLGNIFFKNILHYF